MDIKGSEEKLHHVDSFLTTLTKVLKKHWLILSLILLGFGVYCIATMPDEVIVDDTELYYEDETAQDGTAYDTVDEYYDEDSATYYEQ